MPRLACCCALVLALTCRACPVAAQPVTKPEPAQPNVAVDAGATDPSAFNAQIDSAVARLAAQAKAEAAKLLKDKSYPAALRALENAHELDPRDAATTLQLSDLQQLLGHAERAEQLYRESIKLAPESASAYVALGDLLARDPKQPARLEEAAALYARAREILGADPTLLLHQARLAHTRGLFDDAERAYQAYLGGSRADDTLRLELGDFYRDAGKPDQALDFYRHVEGAPTARLAAQRIFELEVDREARRYGLGRRDAAANEQARALAAKARVVAANGDPKQAEARLRDALALAPALGELHADLADVLRSSERTSEAELEYLRALALDGSDPETHTRLAELYLRMTPAQTALAAVLLERALALRPDWNRPQLLLAQAYQSLADFPRALLHVKHYLEQAQPGSERDDAVALEASLEALLGEGTKNAAAANSGTGTDTAARDPLARARAFLARGQTDAALRELRQLHGAAFSRDAMLLEARVLHTAGRLEDAAKILRRSLDGAPDQPEARALLGEVLLAHGETEAARAQLVECEHAGLTSCSYALARLDAAGDAGALSFAHDLPQLFALLHARTRLHELSTSARLSVSPAELTQLRERVDARLHALLWFTATLVLLAIGLGFAARRARYGGVDLTTLIDQKPEAGADVQRVLSAIRHEVLKHNTMMLAGVSEALSSGAPLGERGAHVLSALFGDDGSGGVERRLLAYVEQLNQIGRSHGLRLNLARRDRAFGAMLTGFAQLRSLAPALRRADQLSPSARARLSTQVRSANEALHVQGQTALRELLDHVRDLTLDQALVRTLFERIRKEPGLASADIAELAIDATAALPCVVLVPRPSFEDIVGNLFRNAIQAALRGSERPVLIGFASRIETDDVTGIERVAIFVRDRAPEELDREALRSGYIEKGLGLTADLVLRHDGQLDISLDEPGFAKAVVLRLPGHAVTRENLVP